MPSSEANPSATSDVDFDAIVVGGGMGGIYAVYRLQKDGLTVQAFEGGADVGGVWFHNKYPGARVDVEGAYYSFYFDQNVYDEWEWKERYPAQPEIQAYL
ncbi:MAG: NAD(P)/FAD-dependent oxidoreductase, partial [Nocardioidaceae bacterium]|nr:NAD(P)/FAD-dependent oxidoreductase [Nocardioidaceae bacterium]